MIYFIMLNSLDSLVGIEAVKQQPYLRKEVAESFCHARDLQWLGLSARLLRHL